MQDWRKLLDHGAEQSDAPGPGRQRLAPKAVKLPPWREPHQANLQDLPRQQGMVVGLFPGGAIVRHEGRELLCGVAGTFRAPDGTSALAVGDTVTVAMSRSQHANAGGDMDRADGMILARDPRRTLLCRPQPRSAKRRDPYATESFEKVIAANMDVLLIVASVRAPAIRPGVIDRFLIVAERGGLEPLVAINKTDLAQPPEALVHDLRGRGVSVLPCSAVTGEGLGELLGALAHRQSVLAGASGVGKSTLINALVPGAEAATAAVRRADQRGRHTTSGAAVYDLLCGGMVVDTPGVRELGVGLSASELPWYFPEFEPHAAGCRFNDCTHTHEPICAVRQAAEDGTIPRRRYFTYLRLLETLDD